MSLLVSIIQSDYAGVLQHINNGDNINAILNGNPPKSMLDIAIEARQSNPKIHAGYIVTTLKAKGAKTYDELQSDIGIERPKIKNVGIAGVGSVRRSVTKLGGTRRCRNRRSRSRRSNRNR